ncbi:integral membrane protein, partial [Streptomyces lividans TK24]
MCRPARHGSVRSGAVADPRRLCHSFTTRPVPASSLRPTRITPRGAPVPTRRRADDERERPDAPNHPHRRGPGLHRRTGGHRNRVRRRPHPGARRPRRERPEPRHRTGRRDPRAVRQRPRRRADRGADPRAGRRPGLRRTGGRGRHRG